MLPALTLEDLLTTSSTAVPSNQNQSTPMSPSQDALYTLRVSPWDSDSSKIYDCVIGGFFIPFSKSSAWIRRNPGIGLAKGHSQGNAVMQRLTELSTTNGYRGEIRPCGSDPKAMDVLFVTRNLRGTFINDGSARGDVFEGPTHLITPGKEDEEACKMLSRELGQWTRVCLLTCK